MIKIYRKTATIKAEQFDGSEQMRSKYELDYEYDKQGNRHYYGGDIMELMVDDWIITTIDGLHWTIKDFAFKQTYAELPVIPQAVADWIKKCKKQRRSITGALVESDQPAGVKAYFRNYQSTELWIKLQDDFARAWLDGYQVEESK